MARVEQTDVLVVGAGPVGMLTGLLLARNGVRVRIVDEDSRTASRTYACALHSHTLELLDSLGIGRSVLDAGRPVKAVAFYEGDTRRAEAKLSELPGRFKSVVVVAQSTFEQMLEEKLKQDVGVRVEWNHRLGGLRSAGHSAVALIEKLGISAKGYIIPEMDWSVERSTETSASYVVGADGPNSSVAHALGVEFERQGEQEFYAVFEFQSNWDCGDELRVVLDKDTTSVLWPLPGNKFRWSFQLREEHMREFPSKDRSALVVGSPEIDRANREFVQKLIRLRAPWFKGDIQAIGWSTDVEFDHRVARRFGVGHSWLVGDAAHQTGPAGMQSMNMGLQEAEELAGALSSILRNQASASVLEAYHEKAFARWLRLLGVQGAPKPRPKTDRWVKEHSARILRCLPASGDDLARLMDQMQLDWEMSGNTSRA
ncbi:MAG: FAD-dependent oxidoreductase [Verrucomicrobiia bacterium]